MQGTSLRRKKKVKEGSAVRAGWGGVTGSGRKGEP